jgi:4-amino-4-deoxy-L-arabinose transferase-like glycosyltransferase
LAENGTSFWLTAPRRFAHDRLVVLGLVLVLGALYLPGLGSYGLYDPWETHYGEVARTMVETGNYIDPWWGSPWDPTDVKREKEGFYSKPPMTMWMQAAGMNVLGYTEWGVRLFFPIITLLALLAVYLAVSRFYNRRAGLLAVAVAATAPFIAFPAARRCPMAPRGDHHHRHDGPASASSCVDEDEEAGPALYWGTVGLLVA